MTASCRLVASRLPMVGGGASLGRALDDHVTECLRCQAETARYRRLGRALSGLSTDLVPAPAGFAASVEFALDRDSADDGSVPARSIGRVAAATGAVAAAAGIVAVAVWRRTHHAA